MYINFKWFNLTERTNDIGEALYAGYDMESVGK